MDADGNTEESLKLRGIKLNVKASESLGYTKFRERVLKYGRGEDVPSVPILLEYRMLRADNRGKIFTVCQSKKYEPLCQKGVIRKDANLTVVPFGWCDE